MSPNTWRWPSNFYWNCNFSLSSFRFAFIIFAIWSVSLACEQNEKTPFFLLQSEKKKAFFSLIFALSENERRTLISTFNVTGLHVRRKYVRYSTYYGRNILYKKCDFFFFENPGHVVQTVERKTLRKDDIALKKLLMQGILEMTETYVVNCRLCFYLPSTQIRRPSSSQGVPSMT